MKAKDIITPGDYEVRPFKGGERKVRIVRVEKVTIRVYDEVVRAFFPSEQWRAFPQTEEGSRLDKEGYPLGQIVRPWAEAELEHRAREERAEASDQFRERLSKALTALDLSAGIDIGTSTGITAIRMNREKAERLAELLEGLAEA